MEKFMSSVSDWLEKRILPVAMKLSTQRHLLALRDGFIATMPVSMAGAINVMIKEVFLLETSIFGEMFNKIGFYNTTIQPFLEKTVIPVSNQIWWGTLALGIIFTVLAIAYKLAEQNDGDALSAGVLAIIAYFVFLPQSVGDTWGVLSYESFNSTSVFAGLIIALVSTEIFLWVNKKGWTIKMPPQVPSGVSRAFSAIIPSGIVLVLMGSVSVFFLNVVQVPFKDWINIMLQDPLQSLGQSPLTFIFLIFFAQVLWFFGIHGILVVNPILDTMYAVAGQQNSEAILIHGTMPPNSITRNFGDMYGMFGGSGSTLGLIIAIFLVSKRAEQKSLAKLAATPGIFMINEPIIYGLPIVLNPIMAIPFIFAPPITITVAWFFTEIIPFAGRMYLAPPWVTPPVINAFLASGGDIPATILSAAMLALSVAIYIPFVILSNKMEDIVD